MTAAWLTALAAVCLSLTASAQPISSSQSSPSSGAGGGGLKAPFGFIKNYNGKFVADDCTEFIFTGFDRQAWPFTSLRDWSLHSQWEQGEVIPNLLGYSGRPDSFLVVRITRSAHGGLRPHRLSCAAGDYSRAPKAWQMPFPARICSTTRISPITCSTSGPRKA